MSFTSSLQQQLDLPEGAGPDGSSRQLVPQYDGLSNDSRRWQQLCLLGVSQCQHLPCVHSPMRSSHVLPYAHPCVDHMSSHMLRYPHSSMRSSHVLPYAQVPTALIMSKSTPCNYSLIHSSVHSFTEPFMHSPSHSFIPSFVRPSIQSWNTYANPILAFSSVA